MHDSLKKTYASITNISYSILFLFTLPNDGKRKKEDDWDKQ